MPESPTGTRVMVFGGAGVFGSLVAEEVHRLGLRVTIAGRNIVRAAAVAQRIGGDFVQVDVQNAASCRAALADVAIAIHCAGPFEAQSTVVLEACLDARCHYIDIADDRGYARVVAQLDERFRQAGLTAAYGCSSLPGISGALALAARERLAEPAHAARVSLFIGQNNAKGSAAVASAARLLGRTIHAPQGALIGFRDPEQVDFPQPFGRRTVLNFESPEYDLFPRLLGTSVIKVKVGFELRLATIAFRSFATYAPRLGQRILPALTHLNGATRWLGSSGGVVMTELFDIAGNRSAALLMADSDGQRMAALPAALVAARLATGDPPVRGVTTAYELLGAVELIQALVKRGYCFLRVPN